MKKILFTLLCILSISLSFAIDGEKRTNTILKYFGDDPIGSENIIDNLSQDIKWDCYYFIAVFDKDGNYIGKYEEDTVHTVTAKDCIDYVEGIANDMQQEYPDCTLKIRNEYY